MVTARLERSIVRISGDGVVDWLDGLITNSLSAPLTFAALLTPQGKIIADFFVTRDGDTLYLDMPPKFLADVTKRLKLYRLRAPIKIEDVSGDHAVYASWNSDAAMGHADPRLPALGFRFIAKDAVTTDATQDDYNSHRLSLGIPDSEWDYETVTRFPADANMDLLNGIDFKKGCFVGQEVVSRMKRMTTVKKRMRGLVFEADAPQDTDIKCGERVVGSVLYATGNMGMGLIRIDRLDAADISPTVAGQAVSIMDGPDGQ